MKKYFLILFGGLILTTACENQLNRAPVDSLISSTAFETVDDLEAGLIGVYGGWAFNNVIAHNSIFTDNTKIGADNGGQQLALVNLQLDPTLNSAGIWTSRYNTINDCNRIIEAAASITPTEEEQDQYNTILANMYAIRAYCHMDLLAYYAEDLNNPNAMGVPYQHFVSATAQPARPTVDETVNGDGTAPGIMGDLATAESLLPAGSSRKDRVNQGFIDMTRARTNLITGNWQGVLNNTTNIINNFQLADQNQYLAMFAGDQDQTEVIFTFDNVDGFNTNIANIWIFTGTDGNFIEMSFGLFDELANRFLNEGDVRVQANFNPATDGVTEHGIFKYPGSGGVFINDFKVFRASEAYLMRAEAFAELNQLGNAAAMIQEVKNARTGLADAPSAFANLSAARTAILSERRVELSFEGQRYLDLKRFRNRLNQGLVRDPRDCPGSVPCELNVTDPKWTFPIPLVELNGNVNMVQNPQWL
ncbi:MAG: RagB/SusD family nutrient uptake outer membrane protein [Flavobacteriaceae bacterium]|nr:RagB/SusD family nutrient uptake outer membrane protein [Flavobacteriaceae bacterium]